MKRTIARRTRRAYFLVLLVPFVLGILVLWFADNYRSTIGWVSHTQVIVAQLDELLLLVTEAESYQRGYFLTGEEHYAAEFRQAKQKTVGKISELKLLIKDNASQLRRMEELSPLIAKRMAALQQLIDLRSQSSTSNLPAAVPIRRGGALLMTGIRNLIGGMIREENRLLGIRWQNLGLAELQLGVSFGAGLLINVALLYRAYKLLILYGIERDIAESEILELNEDLERRVEERTVELQNANKQLTQSNEDLSRFAYIASHDLQEPLRTVASYAGLLERRYSGKFEDDADLYLRMIVSGAKRMQNQVQDLLRYSRVDSRSLRIESFHFELLLNEVKEDLAAAIQERNAVIHNGPLPRVKADRARLLQVLENLLVNSLKFSRPGVAVRIDVNAQLQDDGWLFTVTDNGIGFEPEFAERIFIIFQRLHAVGTYSGTGMGLAICKRIIEAHGGRIWATSIPGTGSAFCFTLPGSSIVAPPSDQTNESDPREG